MTAYDGLGSGYDLGMWPLERLALRRLRRRLFPHAAGRVLELGVGTGVNLPLYPPAVKLLAMDASAGMLTRAATVQDIAAVAGSAAAARAGIRAALLAMVGGCRGSAAGGDSVDRVYASCSFAVCKIRAGAG
jgi:hypothetical protein